MKRRAVAGWGIMLAVCLCAFFSGCGRKQEQMVLHFVFEDAKGITIGDKVMGDGVEVGRVISPPSSPRPRHVIVSVRIDGLSNDKMFYLTDDLSASIRKDSLVAGQTYLDLVFPDAPGDPVKTGAILKGRGMVGDFSGFKVPETPEELVGIFQKLFVSVSPAADGMSVVYLNWISAAMSILTLVALIIDLLIRLPQGRVRETSSPLVLRKIWWMFCIVVCLRFLMFVVRLLGGLGLVGANLLSFFMIQPADFLTLMNNEWPFWIIVILLTFARFKLDLLMKVKE